MMEYEKILSILNKDRDDAAKRIYGLLDGTNEGDDNVIQILEDFGLKAFDAGEEAQE